MKKVLLMSFFISLQFVLFPQSNNKTENKDNYINEKPKTEYIKVVTTKKPKSKLFIDAKTWLNANNCEISLEDFNSGRIIAEGKSTINYIKYDPGLFGYKITIDIEQNKYRIILNDISYYVYVGTFKKYPIIDSFVKYILAKNGNDDICNSKKEIKDIMENNSFSFRDKLKSVSAFGVDTTKLKELNEDYIFYKERLDLIDSKCLDIVKKLSQDINKSDSF